MDGGIDMTGDVREETAKRTVHPRYRAELAAIGAQRTPNLTRRRVVVFLGPQLTRNDCVSDPPTVHPRAATTIIELCQDIHEGIDGCKTGCPCKCVTPSCRPERGAVR